MTKATRRANDMVVASTGHAWVGNFGFESPLCANMAVPPFPDPSNQIPAKHNSVSVFNSDGSAISPDIVGFNQGEISWPQATLADGVFGALRCICGATRNLAAKAIFRHFLVLGDSAFTRFEAGSNVVFRVPNAGDNTKTCNNNATHFNLLRFQE